MENFVLYDELGRGEQRIVYKGRRKGTVNYFAIHCVDKTKRDDLQNSVRISHSLTHKNIVQFYEWYETSNHLWLVVELCSGITLDTILVQDRCLPEDTIRKFGRDIVDALFYLHSQNIVYCDLSPSKVILDGSGVLKLSNFTLAKVDGELDDFEDDNDDLDFEFGKEDGLSRRLVRGHPFYVAPEVLQGSAYTKQSDLWSLGCLMFECFTGKPPYVATQFEDLLAMITSKEVQHPIQEKENQKSKASDDLFSLIKHLLIKDASKRMSIEDLCMHKFWDGTLSYLLSDDDTLSQNESKFFENETRSSYIKQKIEGESEELNAEFAVSSKGEFDNFASDEMEDSVSEMNPSVKSTLGKGLPHLDLTTIGRKSLDCSVRAQGGKEVYSQSRESKQRSDLYGSVELGIEARSMQGNEVEKNDVGVNISLIDLLYHPSDLEVNPIIENPKNSKNSYLKWDPHFVPLSTIKSDKMQMLTKQDVTQHVEAIIEVLKALNQEPKGNDTQKSRHHLLAYICSLARHEIFANSLLEKNVTRILISDLKGTSLLESKQRIGMIILGNHLGKFDSHLVDLP